MKKILYVLFFLILNSNISSCYLSDSMNILSSYGSNPIWDSSDILLLMKKMINCFIKENSYCERNSDFRYGTKLSVSDTDEFEYFDNDSKFFKNLIDEKGYEGSILNNLNNKRFELFDEFLRTREYNELKLNIKYFIDFVLANIFDNKKEKELIDLEFCYPSIILKNKKDCEIDTIFEGNKNVGFNLCFDKDFVLLQNKNKDGEICESLSIQLSLDYSFLFKRIEKRTFGITIDSSDLIWDYYNKDKFFPLPNVITKDVFVFPGNQLSGVIFFSYKRIKNTCKHGLIIGYNFVFNGAEAIREINKDKLFEIEISPGKKIPFDIDLLSYQSPLRIFNRVFCSVIS